MKKQTIRLNESQLNRIIKESVKRVLSESSDSVAPQPFGNDDDMGYVGSDENELYFKKYYPWRYYPGCKTVSGLIQWANACVMDFEEGKYSIKNFLRDLYWMVL